MGSAFVRKASEAGARVFFTFRESRERAKGLEARGARGFSVDLGKIAAIEEFQKQFREEVKVLHVLVHNAGTTRDATIQNMNEEDWDEVLAVNLKAPITSPKGSFRPFLRPIPQKYFLS